jgi:hypothetical protein
LLMPPRLPVGSCAPQASSPVVVTPTVFLPAWPTGLYCGFGMGGMGSGPGGMGGLGSGSGKGGTGSSGGRGGIGVMVKTYPRGVRAAARASEFRLGKRR